jgi:tight adherence protein B
MLLIAIVFVAVFAVILLAYVALSANSNDRRRQTADRLAAIRAGAGNRSRDPGQDLVLDRSHSSIAWVDRLMKRIDGFAQLQSLISAADSTWTIPQFLTYSVSLAALAGGLVYWRTSTVFPSLVLGCVASLCPMLLLLQQKRARLNKFERLLPDALDLMVSSIRAGHGLLSAMGMVARESSPPVSVEFRKCFDEQNFGLDMRVALEHLAERVPLHDVQIVVTALMIQKECGGNLAEILEKVSHVTRERFRLKRQIQVHTAQGRMTGWILALLPLLLGFAIFLVNPTYMERLWLNPIGVKLLYASAVMTLVGALIIRKIVNVRV